jgi:hypothetical protein
MFGVTRAPAVLLINWNCMPGPGSVKASREHAPHLQNDEFFDIDHSMQAIKVAARMS